MIDLISLQVCWKQTREGKTFRPFFYVCVSSLLIFSVWFQFDQMSPKAQGGLRIRDTHCKLSIQDIVDEVAPVKNPPYGVEGRFIRM